ncbi:MAG: HAD hydrolase-like protein [Patescibacteria group bacterium]
MVLLKPECLILDFNGTTENDRDAKFRGVKAIFDHYEVPHPPIDTFFDEVGPDYIKTYRKFGIPHSATAREISQIWETYFHTNRNGIKLQPGLRELLIFARDIGLKRGIVSGEATSILNHRLAIRNLRQFFNLVWGDCTDKDNSLRRACVQLSVERGKTVYVDDNHDGLIQAKTTGIITIGFTAGWQSMGRIAQSNPNFPANSHFKVKEIIADLCST